jgi:hypothetical protein
MDLLTCMIEIVIHVRAGAKVSVSGKKVKIEKCESVRYSLLRLLLLLPLLLLLLPSVLGRKSCRVGEPDHCPSTERTTSLPVATLVPLICVAVV